MGRHSKRRDNFWVLVKALQFAFKVLGWLPAQVVSLDCGDWVDVLVLRLVKILVLINLMGCHQLFRILVKKLPIVLVISVPTWLFFNCLGLFCIVARLLTRLEILLYLDQHFLSIRLHLLVEFVFVLFTIPIPISFLVLVNSWLVSHCLLIRICESFWRLHSF